MSEEFERLGWLHSVAGTEAGVDPGIYCRAMQSHAVSTMQKESPLVYLNLFKHFSPGAVQSTKSLGMFRNVQQDHDLPHHFRGRRVFRILLMHHQHLDHFGVINPSFRYELYEMEVGILFIFQF